MAGDGVAVAGGGVLEGVGGGGDRGGGVGVVDLEDLGEVVLVLQIGGTMENDGDIEFVVVIR